MPLTSTPSTILVPTPAKVDVPLNILLAKLSINNSRSAIEEMEDEEGMDPDYKHKKAIWRDLAISCFGFQCYNALFLKIRKYYFFRSLKACAHSFLRNPGTHHSMHNGSIALALCTLPISSTSNPNFSSIPRTFFFASSLFPQMNMVGFVRSPKSGLTMNADPMLLNAFTNCPSGAIFWSRSIRDSPKLVK